MFHQILLNKTFPATANKKHCCSGRDVAAPIVSVDLQRCMFHPNS
ncbi:unnamed protein product, partial [Larinioides sclopetarius]